MRMHNRQVVSLGRALGRAAQLMVAGCLALTLAAATATARVRRTTPRQQPASGPRTPQEHARHQPRPAKPDGKRQRGAAAAIPDVEVLDQDGRRLRFYTDLVRGKVVAINFIFTSCTTFCPGLGQNFARLQELLGAGLGRDVHLISISTDPVVDTPRRLREWGVRYGRRPGWTLVTGGRTQMEQLLRGLTGAKGRIAQNADHTPVLLMRNDARDQWKSAFGMAPPDRVRQTLTSWGAPPVSGAGRTKP